MNGNDDDSTAVCLLFGSARHFSRPCLERVLRFSPNDLRHTIAYGGLGYTSNIEVEFSFMIIVFI
jgi:hypothetical protein